MLFPNYTELRHPDFDTMTFLLPLLQPGDYRLGNSSQPAVNMHLGMSLLETDDDGGFMVS